MAIKYTCTMSPVSQELQLYSSATWLCSTNSIKHLTKCSENWKSRTKMHSLISIWFREWSMTIKTFGSSSVLASSRKRNVERERKRSRGRGVIRRDCRMKLSWEDFSSSFSRRRISWLSRDRNLPWMKKLVLRRLRMMREKDLDS